MPLPNYLSNTENRLVNKWVLSADKLAGLSKHELLFCISKDSIGNILQVIQLTFVVCFAWTLMALGSEFSEVMLLLGTENASKAIPIRLVLPAVQISMLILAYKLLTQ